MDEPKQRKDKIPKIIFQPQVSQIIMEKIADGLMVIDLHQINSVLIKMGSLTVKQKQ